MLIQIALLIMACGVTAVLLALALLIMKIGREAPETIDRILYSRRSPVGSFAQSIPIPREMDPLVTAGLDAP